MARFVRSTMTETCNFESSVAYGGYVVQRSHALERMLPPQSSTETSIAKNVVSVIKASPMVVVRCKSTSDEKRTGNTAICETP
jgi:hypothetical protein